MTTSRSKEKPIVRPSAADPNKDPVVRALCDQLAEVLRQAGELRDSIDSRCRRICPVVPGDVISYVAAESRPPKRGIVTMVRFSLRYDSAKGLYIRPFYFGRWFLANGYASEVSRPMDPLRTLSISVNGHVDPNSEMRVKDRRQQRDPSQLSWVTRILKEINNEPD